MILVVLLYALMASTFTIGKAALSYFTPLFFIGIRMIPGGLLLLAYLYFFKKTHFIIRRSDWLLFIQMMMFHIYITFGLEFWAMNYLTSSKSCLLYNTSPFFAAIFSYFYFHEQITLKKVIGLLIGFLGFIPILLSDTAQEVQEGMIGFLSWPEIAILVSVVSSVFGWILMRKLVKQHHYSPLMVNGIAMVGGGFFSLVTSYFLEHNRILVPTFSGIAIGMCYVIVMIIIANIITYNLYGYLLRFYSATLLSFVGFICPLFAALYGWLFLGEYIGWSYFITIAIVFCGLYLFYQEELRQGYITRKS